MTGLLAFILGRKNSGGMNDSELAQRINSLIASGQVNLPKKMYMHQISLSVQSDGMSGSYISRVNLSIISELSDEDLATLKGKFAMLGRLIPEDKEIAASGILFDNNMEANQVMTVGVSTYNNKPAFSIRYRSITNPYGGDQAVFDLGMVSNNYGTNISSYAISVN